MTTKFLKEGKTHTKYFEGWIQPSYINSHACIVKRNPKSSPYLKDNKRLIILLREAAILQCKDVCIWGKVEDWERFCTLTWSKMFVTK